jgi:Fe-S-cluster containining protein
MNADAPNDERPWYHEGLRFTCTRCGDCCTGEPGYVWVDDAEARAIAAFLRIGEDELVAMYTKRLPRERTLREKSNGDCIFFERGVGCTIYEVRPRQCRTWPFWESNIESPRAWERTTKACPGSGQGELIPAEEITRRMKVIAL